MIDFYGDIISVKHIECIKGIEYDAYHNHYFFTVILSVHTLSFKNDSKDVLTKVRNELISKIQYIKSGEA